MSAHLLPSTPVVAQATSPVVQRPGQVWMHSTLGLLLLLFGLGIYSKIVYDKVSKDKRFEEYKNRELQKKLKLALNTIAKMEKNPDLIHSREFNLDYLRMRMDEGTFHFSIINQIKIRIKEKISVALRPSQAEQGTLGIASTPRQIDEMFDVEYDLTEAPGGKKAVLFRIQIKLAKLPAQPTSVTVNQIIQCLEKFMSQDAEENENWQPTIQGRIAYIHWDQKAKPTPMLVLEQSQEGVNVTFRTNPMTAKAT